MHLFFFISYLCKFYDSFNNLVSGNLPELHIFVYISLTLSSIFISFLFLLMLFLPRAILFLRLFHSPASCYDLIIVLLLPGNLPVYYVIITYIFDRDTFSVLTYICLFEYVVTIILFHDDLLQQCILCALLHDYQFYVVFIILFNIHLFMNYLYYSLHYFGKFYFDDSLNK